MDDYRHSEQSEREAAHHMLAGLLAQGKLGFFNRLAARAEWRLGRWSEYWSTLSRRGRRAFWRRAAAEDVVGAHVAGPGGDLYLLVLGAFNVGGASGNGKDVLLLTPSGGGYSPSIFWRGGDHGFNLNLGGIEMD